MHLFSYLRSRIWGRTDRPGMKGRLSGRPGTTGTTGTSTKGTPVWGSTRQPKPRPEERQQRRTKIQVKSNVLKRVILQLGIHRVYLHVGWD